MPIGRNASGIRQKINKLKNAMRPEIDALKAGEPLAASRDGTPKKSATGRKRKAEDAGNADGTPKKRGGRKKKKAEVDTDEDADFEAAFKIEEQDIKDEF